jgi:hypothetical protein
MKTKKKTKPKEIPDTYTFTSEDLQWYWDNFDRCCTPNGPDPSVTPQELEFFNITDEADRLSRIIKRLPTMKELREHWQAEQEKKQQERTKMEADWLARNAKKAAV